MTRPVQCVSEEALGEVLALPDADPRRRHLEECPRCHALLVSYRQFLEPSTAETSSYGTAEHEQLNAYRERLIGLAPAASPASVIEPASASPTWSERLFGSSLRPVWAIVAIAIAFGVMKVAPRPGSQAPPTLRGGAPHGLPASAPTYGARGVTLAWSSNPGADHYELRFFSSALAELGRRDVGRDTTVTLAPADLPELYRAGDAILWRVVAMKDGDELESSAPGSLKQP